MRLPLIVSDNNQLSVYGELKCYWSAKILQFDCQVDRFPFLCGINPSETISTNFLWDQTNHQALVNTKISSSHHYKLFNVIKIYSKILF